MRRINETFLFVHAADPLVPEDAMKLRECLERLGVSSEVLARGPATLSTGFLYGLRVKAIGQKNKRKIAGELNKFLVARAIVDAPKLLLLDEVLSFFLFKTLCG